MLLPQCVRTPPRARHPFQWLRKDLVMVAELSAVKTGKRKIMRFGDEEGDVLPAYKSAKVAPLADALNKFFTWKVRSGEVKVLRQWPDGLTPEKAVAKGKGGKSAAEPDRKDHFLILLCCHLANDSTFEGYTDMCKPSDRHALEDKDNSPETKFLKKLAADMMNVDFKDDHDNPISFPATHANDNPRAPDDLLDVMDDVDFGLAKRELHARFHEDSAPLMRAIRAWLKHLASDHKVSNLAYTTG